MNPNIAAPSSSEHSTGWRRNYRDKYERLDNLYGKNLEPAVDDESIDDSWMDMGIYSFMAGMCRAGEWPGFDPKGEDSPEPLPEYGQRWGPVTRRDSEMAEER